LVCLFAGGLAILLNSTPLKDDRGRTTIQQTKFDYQVVRRIKKRAGLGHQERSRDDRE
jgi:hypothetical protein